MKCTECPEYNECSKKYNLTIKRRRCPKAKEEKVVTNGDNLRAMSNEQLAEWLCLAYGCTGNCPGIELCVAGDGKCNGIKKWLNQPAEVE